MSATQRGFLGIAVFAAGLASPDEALASEPSRAEQGAPGTPVAFSPYLFTRFENREGYDRLGVSRGRFSEGSFTVYRARLSLTSAPIRISDGLRAQFRFAPQAAGFLGNLPSTVNTASLGLYEGWARLEGNVVRADVGRLRLNYGDALIIGDLDWNEVGRSFDGARGRIALGDDGWVDLIVTQLADGIAGPGNVALAGDVYFGGIYSSLGGLVDDELVLEPYVLSQVWARSGPDDDRTSPAAQGTAGVRVKRSFGVLDLRVESGVQFGARRVDDRSVDVLAYQGDLEVGVRVGDGVRLSLEGAYATGDDPSTDRVESYDEVFPTTHKWLGLMDVVGIRSNIATAVVHGAFGTGRVKALVDGHVFFRPQTTGAQQGYAGTEIDTQAAYAFGPGMSLRGLYGVFVPGSDHFSVGGQFDDAVAHYVEAQYTLKL